MFVDEVDIQILAGDGGNGCMAFRREKFVPRGGPSGGDGGKGGSVFLVASPHHNTLVTYRFHPEFKAERGQHGQGSNRTGGDGADLVLEVPPGTVAYDHGDNEFIPLADLTTTGERVLIARAGDVGAAARAFRELASDPDLRHLWGARSRELAADWGYGPSVDGFLEAVREAVSDGR